MKRRKRSVIGGSRAVQQQRQNDIARVRHKWLGKRVSFDLGDGQGVQYGKVVSISADGDVLVECGSAPGQSARALALSLGYLDRVLTLVGR